MLAFLNLDHVGRGSAGSPVLKNLVRATDADFVVVDFLLQSIAVDAEHLRGADLVAVVREKCELDQRLFDLLENDVVEPVQFNLSFFLLLEEDFEFALYELLEADALKVRNKKVI